MHEAPKVHVESLSAVVDFTKPDMSFLSAESARGVSADPTVSKFNYLILVLMRDGDSVTICESALSRSNLVALSRDPSPQNLCFGDFRVKVN